MTKMGKDKSGTCWRVSYLVRGWRYGRAKLTSEASQFDFVPRRGLYMKGFDFVGAFRCHGYIIVRF